MKGPCMCGDPYCPSCGPAQGFYRCPICGDIECECPAPPPEAVGKGIDREANDPQGDDDMTVPVLFDDGFESDPDDEDA